MILLHSSQTSLVTSGSTSWNDHSLLPGQFLPLPAPFVSPLAWRVPFHLPTGQSFWASFCRIHIRRRSSSPFSWRGRGKPEFTNEEVYAFTSELEKLHPDNRHVRDKIRQQLQVLRDAKLLVHVGSGVWRLP